MSGPSRVLSASIMTAMATDRSRMAITVIMNITSFLAVTTVAHCDRRGRVTYIPFVQSSSRMRLLSESKAFAILEQPHAVWCTVGNGGMDPYSSPYIIPIDSLHTPFPHSLPRTRQHVYRCCSSECISPKPYSIQAEPSIPLTLKLLRDLRKLVSPKP